MELHFPPELPISAHIPEMIKLLQQHQVIVIAGETGSGKSTQLPKLCLQLFRPNQGIIGHTQPRRIAARTIAARIAEELQTPLGQVVGYQVRFQDNLSSSTQIKVMTDGILLAEIRRDPWLKAYQTLIIDEAHERSLNIDFLLGFLQKLLPKRPDLKLIITSATLDHERMACYFNAPVLEVSGRSYPVEMRYEPLPEKAKNDPLAEGIIQALKGIEVESHFLDAHILVFLPTERDIHELQALLVPQFPKFEILRLFARLSLGEQQKVFATKNAGPRIILATNVAETSLTIPGIRYVIDSGLARLSRYNPKLKIQRLPIEAISQANAKQRAGRAGRTSAGICIRLYSETDFNARPGFTPPEILRTNLAAVILQMLKLKLGRIEHFPLLDMPDQRLIHEGYQELLALKFIETDADSYRLTELGQQASMFPLDPRLARMLLAGGAFKVLTEILIIVSHLSVQDPREVPLEAKEKALNQHRRYGHPESEFLSILNLWWYFQQETEGLSQNKIKNYCKNHFLSYMRMREWQALYHELLTQTKPYFNPNNLPEASEGGAKPPLWAYEPIHKALLTGTLSFIGYFDTDIKQYIGGYHKRFQIFPGSMLARAQFKWLMAESLMETQKVYARLIARINPTWLEPLAAHLLKRQYHDPHFDVQAGAVKAYETVLLYGLPIIHGRKVHYARIDPVAARAVFIRTALLEGALLLKPEFLQKNLAVLSELKTMEAKLRRLDLSIDEAKLLQFYDAHLPASIMSNQELQQWLQQASQADKDALQFDLYNLLEGNFDVGCLNAYPDQLNFVGIDYQLSYHFELMSDQDGLSLYLPLVHLFELPDAIDTWLVPGLLREKVSFLLKELPKAWRKLLMPINTTVADFMASLGPNLPYQCSFYACLAKFLLDYLKAQQSQIKIDSAALQAELEAIILPAYLQLKIILLDQEAKILAQEASLRVLQAEFAERVNQEVSDLEHDWAGLLSKSWQFQDLPATYPIKMQGRTTEAYPTIVAEKTGVKIELLLDYPNHQQKHAEGVFCLIAWNVKAQLERIFRDANLGKLAANLSFLQDKQALLEDLSGRVLESALIQHFDLEADVRILELQEAEPETNVGKSALQAKLANIRSESDFTAALMAKNRLYTEFELWQKWFEDLVREVQVLRLSLRNLSGKKGLAESFKDLEVQFDKLLKADFIKNIQIQWLRRYPVYIKGMNLRLARLTYNPEREFKCLPEFVSLYERHMQQKHAKLLSFYFEELRLCLFAPELKPGLKISLRLMEKFC